MKKSRYTDEQIAFAEAGGNRHAGGRGHPPDGNFVADVLPMEEGLWWSLRWRAEAPEAARG